MHQIVIIYSFILWIQPTGHPHHNADAEGQIQIFTAPGITENEDSAVGNLSSTPLGLLFTHRFQFSRPFENPSHFAPTAKPWYEHEQWKNKLLDNVTAHLAFVLN